MERDELDDRDGLVHDPDLDLDAFFSGEPNEDEEGLDLGGEIDDDEFDGREYDSFGHPQTRDPDDILTEEELFGD